jgi:hypothetical protein
MSDLLDPVRDHISKFWSEQNIEQIEKDHRDLVQAYIPADSWIVQAMKGHNHVTMHVQ